MSGIGKGPDQILLQQDSQLPVQPYAGATASNSDALYEYYNNNSIEGIPVSASAQGLPIADDNQLANTLKLHESTKLFINWISPQDTQTQRQLNDIYQRAQDGSVVIRQQQKQMDIAKGRVLVLLRYSELSYVPNMRYKNAISGMDKA